MGVQVWGKLGKHLDRVDYSWWMEPVVSVAIWANWAIATCKVVPAVGRAEAWSGKGMGITSIGVSRTKRVGLVLISLPCLWVPGQPWHTRVSHRQPFAFTTLLPHTTPINPNTHVDFSKHTCKYDTHALTHTHTTMFNTCKYASNSQMLTINIYSNISENV